MEFLIYEEISQKMKHTR